MRPILGQRDSGDGLGDGSRADRRGSVGERRWSDGSNEDRELLAIAAHDLRSPLATAQGFVELLRQRWDGIDDEERRYYLERASGHLDDLSDLLGDLLNVARTEAAQEGSQRAVPLDIAELVHDVTSTFDETHPDRPVTSRVTTSRPVVVARRQNIERVLRNLLANALAYSPAGSSVQVEVSESGDEIVVAVRDQGRGISSSDQQRLFRRFSRASEDGKGSGLGLYICRRLLELEGGRIWVDSEPGCGSTFSFALRRG